MTNYLLLALSLAAVTLGTVTKKIYTIKTKNTPTDVFMFNAVGCAVSALILLAWGGITSLSGFTVWLAIVFGIAVMVMTFANLVAFNIGPMSYTSVIISFSTLISALSGVLFFNETISPIQIAGIVLMLGSFALSVDKNSDEKRASLRWLILCIIAFLCNGAVGIMQKVHQSSAYKEELNGFLVIAFLTSFIISLGIIIFLRVRTRAPMFDKSIDKRTLLLIAGITVICGACTAVNNKLNLFLSGVMDSAVFFPIANGGMLILSTLAALVLFKEKLSAKQWIGIAAGIVAVILLCNPF